MGYEKKLYKIIAGFLIFFLVSAVTVPVVNSCERSCCTEEQVVNQSACHEPTVTLANAIPDMRMTHVTMSDSFFPFRDNTSSIPDCHETKSHSCCEVDMPLATTKAQDFGNNTSQTEYYQSMAVLASVSEFISDSDLFHLIRTDYLTATRAAPVQLFLKNLSLLF